MVRARMRPVFLAYQNPEFSIDHLWRAKTPIEVVRALTTMLRDEMAAQSRRVDYRAIDAEEDAVLGRHAETGTPYVHPQFMSVASQEAATRRYGDIVVAVDGAPVRMPRANQIAEALYPPGTRFMIKKGTGTLKYRLTEMPSSHAAR
ncbi:hypothetical protein WJ88_20800 [Burkholderia ubonensis]|nr:hypothetical protein WJ88_20800 [Burkholderia ubonensis]